MSTLVIPSDTHGRSAARWLRRRPEIPLSLGLFVIFIGGWQLALDAFGISSLLVPTPWAIAKSLWIGLSTNAFTYHWWITFYETISGFAMGAAFGLVAGGFIAQFTLLQKTVYPYIIAFQTVPKVAIAPIFVIWFGYGVTSKIVITATIAFFPVLANTIVGLRAAPSEQIELLRAMTASRWQIFRQVLWPNALPYIFVGLDVSIVLSVIGAIVGEFVGAQAGLGYLILQRTFNMDTAGMFAILILLSAMGLALHGAVQFVQRRVIFWAASNHERIALA